MLKQITPTITKQWVKAHILDSIYLNDTRSLPQIAPFRVLPQRKIELVMPQAKNLQIPSSELSTADRILEIMLSSKVRRGSRAMIEPYLAPIRAAIERNIKQSQPISFILPSLPFKDQSPFTTGASIDHVDLAEYSFFAHLRHIIDAIQEVYPPGGHFTVLCDGFVYADIFANNDTDGAGRYKAKCESIKNLYSLYNQVTLFDMREVLFDFPEWSVIHDRIKTTIAHLFNVDLEVQQRMNGLAQKFVYHVELPDLSYEDARQAYQEHPWPTEIRERLLHSALAYCTLQLTLKKTELVHRAFPAAIRCTVHPKPASQLPLHLTNSHNQLLPYNGVAAVSRTALNHGQSPFEALRIKRLCDLYSLQNVTALYVHNEKDPYYYEIE